MKIFDWEEFISDGIIVHCKTEQENNDFLGKAIEHSIIWRDGTYLFKNNYFSKYTAKTCYRVLCRKEMIYSSIDHYKQSDYKILEWSDYMEFTKEDLKAGMLVEIDCTRMLVMPCENGLFLANKTNWSNLGEFNIDKVWGLTYGGTCVFDLKEDFRPLLYERPTTKEMTVEEISKALGYDVKVVKG